MSISNNLDDLGYVVWDNQPGGRVVRRFQKDNIKYVVVVFKQTDTEYIYLQGSNART